MERNEQNEVHVHTHNEDLKCKCCYSSTISCPRDDRTIHQKSLNNGAQETFKIYIDSVLWCSRAVGRIDIQTA